MTEILQKTRNPEWNQSIIINYVDDPVDTFRFQVLSGTEVIGSVECTSETLMARQPFMAYLLRGAQKQTVGTIIIRSEEVRDAYTKLTLHLAGHNIEKKDIFGKSDPYLIFYRLLQDGRWLECYRTEKIMGTTEPIWKPFEITLHKLCNGDPQRAIRIDCYDWDRIGSDEFIGSINVCLSELLFPGTKLSLINPQTIGDTGYENSGIIEVTNATTERRYSFKEYQELGTSIKVMVGIDFTFSNGEYTKLSSLHYSNASIKNEYQRAIESLGETLDQNILNPQYEAYGFGGQPKWLNKVSHCFSLSRNEDNPVVDGFSGIIDSYLDVLPDIQLAGPTYFHFLLEKAVERAREATDGKLYFVVMLITDGDLDDFPETRALIIEACKLPISIIVVGVGDADFSNMISLDSDAGPLKSPQMQAAERDLVQFVPYRQFVSTPQLLGGKVLEELPNQFETYMRNAGIVPKVERAELIRRLTIKS